MAEGATERVGQGGERGGGDTASRGEPELAEVRGCCEDERLGETDEDLSEHYDAVLRWGGACASIADPIATEDEERGGDEGETWAAGMEGVDRGR